MNVLQLKKELQDLDNQKDLNKFYRIVQTVLIAMLMLFFVGIITTNENAETSIGERTLQIFKERGWLE